jgi:signal transduction histidine kinase/DNA-binding response OmpR family regulator
MMKIVSILTVQVCFEEDVILARQRAREITRLLKFNPQDITRLTTAVFEIARNMYNYSEGGTLEFFMDCDALPQRLMIRFTDKGPGISNLEAVLEGRHKSKTGMGVGIIGARRLMDHFEINSVKGQGTMVLMGKNIPEPSIPINMEKINQISAELTKVKSQSSFEEIEHQNQDLLMTLEELRTSQEDLSRLNSELEETNRGVVALYAELNKKKEELEKANQQLEGASRLKSQFLANMSHELRSPLNSIIGFTGIILQGIVGELNEEQTKQLGMVYDSAKHLLELINDILDLSKIEAGKIEIRPAEFELREFIQLVGKMVSPLIDERGLTLEIVLSEDLPRTLYNDKNRIKQVMINLLSNAIKFTEKGKIRLEAGMLQPDEGGAATTIEFHVSDTGIGIKPDHIRDIFDEFKQIEGSLKDKPAGTGLGLTISKRLVEMMGGKIWVDSKFGEGSVFHITVPCKLADVPKHLQAVLQNMLPDKNKKLIITIDDEVEAQKILKVYLKTEGYDVIQAYNAMEAMQFAKKYQPFAITLDIIMPGKDGWDILKELKDHPETESIPVICISMLDNRDLGLSLGAFNYLVKPVGKEQFINELRRIEKSYTIYDVLIIDDDPKAVDLISRYLGDENGYGIRKANGGKEGLEKVSEQLPDLVILDLMMPDVDGFEVLGHLKESETTKHIPIIIVSGKTLTNEETDYLNDKIVSIINKHAFKKEKLLRDIKKTLDDKSTKRR